MRIFEVHIFYFILYLLNVSQCGTATILDSEIVNCSIHTNETYVRDKLWLLLASGGEVIFIHLSFPDQADPFINKSTTSMFKPMMWVRTTGRRGHSLLYLRPQFEELSLTTLSLMTAYMDVALTQLPMNCLLHLNTIDIEEKIRNLLLSDFKADDRDGSFSEDEYICNMHVRNDNSYARFLYQCCHRMDGMLICQDMNKNFWIEILFTCMYGINILALMFSPYLIPSKLYNQKYEAKEYEIYLKNPLLLNPMEMNNIDTQETNSYDEDLKLKASKITIRVPRRRLVAANIVPVGIFKAFYTMIVKCNIRKIEPYKRCCTARITRNLFAKKQNKDSAMEQGTTQCWQDEICKYPWFRCLQLFTKCLIILGVLLPWIIRVLFYFLYEQKHSVEQKKAAEIRNMTFPFQWNLTNTLSPIHASFICCYLILCFEALVVGNFSCKVIKYLQSRMRDCIRYMQDAKRSKVFEWAFLVIFLPCQKMGIIGIFLFGIYILFVTPVILVVFVFYCLPTANLIFQIFSDFFLLTTKTKFKSLNCKNLKNRFHLDILLQADPRHECENCQKTGKTSVQKEADKNNLDEVAEPLVHQIASSNSSQNSLESHNKNPVILCIILLVCLITIVSFTFLAMELIVFLVEVFMYSLIGIILNASYMLKYLSLIFMLWLYARDCFSGISETYLQFNKALNRLVVDKIRKEVEDVAKNNVNTQKPTAFQIEDKPIDDKKMNSGNENGPSEEEYREKFEKDSKNQSKSSIEHIKMNNGNEIGPSQEEYRDKSKSQVEKFGKDSKWKLKITKLILFLDEDDMPHLTEKFFRETCEIKKTVGVPGPLIHNIVKASWRFLCICIFLMFVVLVVLAFGNEFGMSGTNQMLATLAGGFLPWVFRNVFFKSKDALTIDKENIYFKMILNEHIENYEQSWDITEIEYTLNSSDGRKIDKKSKYILST